MYRVTMAACLWLVACGGPTQVADFAGTGPVLDPVRFFAGHVRSWGVMERFGRPIATVATDCVGEADGDTLRMTQTLRIGDEAPQVRRWVMRRTAPGRYEATANDMVGTATGEAAGRAYHWRWTLALPPGGLVRDVTLEQWWFLLDDGSMLNRTHIRKLGFTVAEVTEHFARVAR